MAHPAWHEVYWGEAVNTPDALLAQLRQHMLVQPDDGLVVRNIPNARVHAYVQALDELRQDQAAARPARNRGAVAQPACPDKRRRGPRKPLGTQHRPALRRPRHLVALAGCGRCLLRPPYGQCDRYRPSMACRCLPADRRCQPDAWHSYTNNPMFGKLSRSLAPALRTWLQEKLPDYMTPAAFVLLEALPLTPNGKVDRKALPAPDLSALARQDGFVAPHTPTEIAVAAIWAEVLGIDPIGIHDDFFALGGHSLLATQVISRIRQTLSVEIPLRALFEAPTVAGLAAQIDALLQVNGAAAAVEIPPADRSQPLPLSFAQQRLWFLEQLGAAAAYNMPFVLRLDGALNVAALQQTLQAIVDRHESLRTTFAVDEGQPYQVVHSAIRIDLPVLDLRDYPQTPTAGRGRAADGSRGAASLRSELRPDAARDPAATELSE